MITSKKLEDLYEPVRRAAEELIKRMAEKGYTIGVTSTFRDVESQNELYAQGRTKPGRIITKAKGGDSIHNYRLAFDIFQNKKGDAYNLDVLKMAGKMAEEMGLEWGGSWKGFVDMPHIQWTGGLTLKELKTGKRPPATAKLKWEQKA